MALDPFSAVLGGDLAQAAGSALMMNKQMDFQEHMSNTAYQRAANDLQAAGLNRILAFGSPASTPMGAGFTVPNFGSDMSSAIASRQAIATGQSQAKALDAQAIASQSTAGLNGALAAKAAQDTITGQSQAALNNAAALREASTATLNAASTKKLGFDTRISSAEADKQDVVKGIYKAAQPFVTNALQNVPGLVNSSASAVHDAWDWLNHPVDALKSPTDFKMFIRSILDPSYNSHSAKGD